MSEAESRAGSDGEFCPWEEAGAVRGDLPPHRSELLRWLSIISLVCSAAGLLFLVPAGLGIVLGAVTYLMAERDIVRMRRGHLDPRGKAQAQEAYRRAGNAVALGLVAPLVCSILWCGFLSIMGRYL